MAKYVKVVNKTVAESFSGALMDTTDGQLYAVTAETAPIGPEWPAVEFVDDAGDTCELNIRWHLEAGTVEIVEV